MKNLHRRLYLPCILWFCFATGVFFLALGQQYRLEPLVPFLNPDTAYFGAHVLFLVFILFVWPAMLPSIRRDSSKRSHGILRFLTTSLSIPLSVFLLMMPLFVVGGFFASKSAGHSIQIGLAWVPLMMFMVAFQRLGFFFEWRLLRVHYLGALVLCAGIPIIDLILSVMFGRGTGAFLALNPFHFLAVFADTKNATQQPEYWSFFLAWAGLSLVVWAIPVSLGRPPHGAYEIFSYYHEDNRSQ
jgi:hypothetical protein